MWIPKNPPGGWPVKVLVALGSLGLIHLGVMVAHHVLDDTSPADIVYPLDRAVEAVEIQWAKLLGSEAYLEARLYSAHERVRETEVMMNLAAKDAVSYEEIVPTVQALLEDAFIQADLALLLVQHEVSESDNEDSVFSEAILVQSALEDMMLRVSNLLLLVDEHMLLVQMSENFLVSVQSLLDVGDAIVDGFDVSDDVRLTVRERARQQIIESDSGRVDDGQLDVVSECALDGQVCGTTADCCNGQGLTCMPFQSSTGFTRRCQRTVHSICETECQITAGGSAQWSQSLRCRAGYIEPDMPPCTTLAREACNAVAERTDCWQR